MNISLFKNLKWFFVDQFMLWGGSSGGGGGPTTTTQVTSNIPDYAKPYVENMLQSTQAQIYNDDMTTFRPYTPYSSDPNDYVAGFSPLQQSAQQSAYNMTTPGQFNAASGLAGMSGVGSMGIAGQAAGAGQQYAQQATNPYATQAYMSPYMQNVVDYQKSQAVRDFGMGQGARKAQAVGQGAFGGNRQALMESEAQRGLMSQLGGIEATGAQQAFQNAQQQQQFGANLGLQGYGTALQGLGQANQAAGTLGQLGTQQLGAEQSIINTQNQMGAQQQQQEQQKINQAIQDYATAQQYPMMQLGMMNAMLRGLPLQQSTTQQYQAAPSAVSQLGGLAATGIGAYGALKAGGGKITEKSYAAGGNVKGYAGDEGSVVGLGVLDDTKAKLESLPTSQLKELAASSSSEMIREKAKEVLATRQPAVAAKRPAGIAAAPVPESMFSAAGGGIVAFAGEDGSLVEKPEEKDAMSKLISRNIDLMREKGLGVETEERKALRAQTIADRDAAEAGKDKNAWLALMKGGAKAMAGKSQYALSNIGEGISEGVGAYAKGEKDYADILKGIRAGEIDINKLDATERNNLLHYALTGAVSEQNALEAGKTRRQTASIAAANRNSDKVNSLFSTMYSANLKSAQDKLGIDAVTPEMRDAISEQTMQQVDTVLSAQGKKGLNTKGKNKAVDVPTIEGAKPTTQAEYNKLPKGAHYIDPNGKTRIKG
jgi:hypothetical protein